MSNIGEIRTLVDAMLRTNEAFAVDLRDGDIALGGAIDSLGLAATSLRLAYELRSGDYQAQLQPGSRAENAEMGAHNWGSAFAGQMDRFFGHVEEDGSRRASRLIRHIEEEFGEEPANPLMFSAKDHLVTAAFHAVSATHTARESSEEHNAYESQTPEVIEHYAGDLIVCRNGLVTAIEESKLADGFFRQYRETL